MTQSAPSASRSEKVAKQTKRKALTASPRKRANKSAVDIAIATDLAPAAAIAVLDKSSENAGANAAALDVLVAGVSKASDDGKVRVQLMFESGAVLPVEMSRAAGAALEGGLADTRGHLVPAPPAE